MSACAEVISAFSTYWLCLSRFAGYGKKRFSPLLPRRQAGQDSGHAACDLPRRRDGRLFLAVALLQRFLGVALAVAFRRLSLSRWWSNRAPLSVLLGMLCAAPVFYIAFPG